MARRCLAEPMAIDALEYLQPSPLVSPSAELQQFIAALEEARGQLERNHAIN